MGLFARKTQEIKGACMDSESHPNEGTQYTKGKSIDSPWELNEKDRFIFNDELFKIIKKRKNKMIVRRMSDKRRIVINR